MSAANNNNLAVSVSIEATDEYQVQEISYDGTEKYVQPLSMSEHMTKLAQRIDFSKFDDEPTATNESDSRTDSTQLATWPWESVRNRVKNAHTEVTVLLDVLNIVKEKQYMVLDLVSQDQPDYKSQAAFFARKRALGYAASLIGAGADRLRASCSSNPINRSADFYSELMIMRKKWRMKKVGNTILGDLSFKSVGSRFPHSGTFEVTKNENATAVTSAGPKPCALKVTVPPDLEGVAYIHVSIQKTGETLASHDFSIPLSAVSTFETSWQNKLESAQNVLFCKELFTQLAREAVQVQLPVPTIVMGNQIIANLLPGVQLTIALCHSTVSDGKSTDQKPVISRKDHKPVLEHSLHQLLREVHYKSLHQPMPHPTTATLGLSRKHYLAGPMAYEKSILAETTHMETSLEQLIPQAQHVILRHRTLGMIDSLAKEITDPCIVVHWTCLNSPTKCSIKVNITSYGYESLHRTPLVVHVEADRIKAINRDGKVFHMSYETQELRYLLLSQVSQHQIHAVHSLAKMMGWKLLSFNVNCGIGPVEPMGTASSMVLASPNGERIIALRHGTVSGPQVSVSSSLSEQVFYPSTLVKERKWQNVTGSFKEVALDRIEGRNLIGKMEYLMASLTGP